MSADGIAESWERDLGQPGWWLRIILFAALAGGLVGAIGFLSGTLLICLFNWTGMIVVGTTLAAILLPGLIRFGRRIGLALGPATILAVVVTAIPISAAVALFSAWAWPKEIGRMSPGDWYFKTVMVETFIVGGWAMLEYARHARSGSADLVPLPAEVSATDVFCLQMEDHYVRIHRPRASSLELMPMKVAIARYGAADGLRVHRSWWVKRTAIRQVEQQGRNWRLVLDGGLIVPVARNRVAALRQLRLD